MLILAFYVPESYKEKVKNALFEAGGGKLENYSKCCWETEGIGQFMPEAGSNPFCGQHEILQREKEYKVEMVCTESVAKKVLKALLAFHPYETPAYHFLKAEEIGE